MLTREQERRVIQSIAETQKLLDKELSYSPKFQKQDYIAECNAHLARLNAMLSPDCAFNAWTE